MWSGAVAIWGSVLGAGKLRKERNVIGIDRCPTLEWLVGTGWHLELAGSSNELVGRAHKDVDGRVLEVSAHASTLDELTWKLLARAAEELEALDGRQAAEVAA